MTCFPEFKTDRMTFLSSKSSSALPSVSLRSWESSNHKNTSTAGYVSLVSLEVVQLIQRFNEGKQFVIHFTLSSRLWCWSAAPTSMRCITRNWRHMEQIWPEMYAPLCIASLVIQEHSMIIRGLQLQQNHFWWSKTLLDLANGVTCFEFLGPEWSRQSGRYSRHWWVMECENGWRTMWMISDQNSSKWHRPQERGSALGNFQNLW